MSGGQGDMIRCDERKGGLGGGKVLRAGCSPETRLEVEAKVVLERGLLGLPEKWSGAGCPPSHLRGGGGGLASVVVAAMSSGDTPGD